MSSDAMIYAELEEYIVGQENVLFCPSPLNNYEVVFEDDGKTLYFYGMDRSLDGNPIVDALHIADVDSITDGHLPSSVHIVWSGDGLKALLLINNHPHAAFNFLSQYAYCRTGFPGNRNWSTRGHDWDDTVMELF